RKREKRQVIHIRAKRRPGSSGTLNFGLCRHSRSPSSGSGTAVCAVATCRTGIGENCPVGSARRIKDIGSIGTTPDVRCGHWGRRTATANTFTRKLSSHVKSEPCLEEQIRSEGKFEEIVGQSVALRQVLQLVETVATTDLNVLLV